jgi:hypothetical protein
MGVETTTVSAAPTTAGADPVVSATALATGVAGVSAATGVIDGVCARDVSTGVPAVRTGVRLGGGVGKSRGMMKTMATVRTSARRSRLSIEIW